VDHLYFADVCAGPGGFTEYVMWRKEGGGRRFQNGIFFLFFVCFLLLIFFQAGAHGWGFTLAGKDDWKLEKFSHDAPTTNFKVDYGVDGKGTKTKTKTKMKVMRKEINCGIVVRGKKEKKRERRK
jgi:hypothetical protein